MNEVEHWLRRQAAREQRGVLLEEGLLDVVPDRTARAFQLTTRSATGVMAALANLLLLGKEGFRTLIGHAVEMAEVLRELIIGRPELSVLKMIIQLLKDGEKVVIFPEGERSWDGEIKQEAQPGVGMIVSKARVPVLPVRIFGAEKALPRGAKWVRPHPVTVVVGEPLDFTGLLADRELSSKERYRQISRDILRAIEALELPEE
jgi:lysophospholipid acyltransferase (LPLAT)-like uncharacterized protein